MPNDVARCLETIEFDLELPRGVIGLYTVLTSIHDDRMTRVGIASFE